MDCEISLHFTFRFDRCHQREHFMLCLMTYSFCNFISRFQRLALSPRIPRCVCGGVGGGGVSSNLGSGGGRREKTPGWSQAQEQLASWRLSPRLSCVSGEHRIQVEYS